MNTPPLPVAELLTSLAGTGPGAQAGPAEVADPRIPGTPPGAATFAALLQSAGLRAEAPSREIPAETIAPETPTDGTPVAESPGPALEALLFLAHVQAQGPTGPHGATPHSEATSPVAATALEGATAPIVMTTPESAASATGLVADRARVSLLPGSLSRGIEAKFSKIAGETTTPSGTRSFPQIDAAPSFFAAWSAEQYASRQRTAIEIAAMEPAASENAAAETATAETKAAEARPVAAIAAAQATSFSTTASPAGQSVAPPLGVDIDTPVSDPAWRSETADRLVSLVTRGVERAELRLSPADLGPVEVRIDVRGGEASLAIVATHATTRDALVQALPMLRDMLAQQGLSLGEATVRDGRADSPPSDRGPAGPDGPMLEDGAAERRTEDALIPLRTLALPRLVDVFA